jgi:hypothetical protein
VISLGGAVIGFYGRIYCDLNPLTTGVLFEEGGNAYGISLTAAGGVLRFSYTGSDSGVVDWTIGSWSTSIEFYADLTVLELYIDGVLVGSASITETTKLAGTNDGGCGLVGQSQIEANRLTTSNYSGTIDKLEFFEVISA